MNQKLNLHVSAGVVSTQHGFAMRKRTVLMEAMRGKTVLAVWESINVQMVIAFQRVFGVITFPTAQITVMKLMDVCAILIGNLSVKLEDVLMLTGSVMERRIALTKVMRTDVMPQQCNPQQQVRTYERHG